MIGDKVFYLYRNNFCAAATEALDGAVTVTATWWLVGGVFSQKPSALLLAGVDPKEPMPICQKVSCRMVIPNISIHARVIQSKSKQKTDPKDAAVTGSDSMTTGQKASLSTTSVRLKSKKGKG